MAYYCGGKIKDEMETLSIVGMVNNNQDTLLVKRGTWCLVAQARPMQENNLEVKQSSSYWLGTAIVMIERSVSYTINLLVK